MRPRAKVTIDSLVVYEEWIDTKMNDLDLLSQRPTYIEVGPLMTTRSGEVR